MSIPDQNECKTDWSPSNENVFKILVTINKNIPYKLWALYIIRIYIIMPWICKTKTVFYKLTQISSNRYRRFGWTAVYVLAVAATNWVDQYVWNSLKVHTLHVLELKLKIIQCIMLYLFSFWFQFVLIVSNSIIWASYDIWSITNMTCYEWINKCFRLELAILKLWFKSYSKYHFFWIAWNIINLTRKNHF